MYPIGKWDPNSVKSHSANNQNSEHSQRMPDSISKVVSSSSSSRNFCPSIMKVPEDLPFPENYQSNNQLQQSANLNMQNMSQNSISSYQQSRKNSYVENASNHMPNYASKYDLNQYPSQKQPNSEPQRRSMTSAIDNYTSQSMMNSANNSKINSLPDYPNSNCNIYKNNHQTSVNYKTENALMSKNAYVPQNQNVSFSSYSSNNPSVAMQMQHQGNRGPIQNNLPSGSGKICFNNMGNRNVPPTTFNSSLTSSQLNPSYQNRNLMNNTQQQMSASMNSLNQNQSYMSQLNKNYNVNGLEQNSIYPQVSSGGSYSKGNNMNLSSTPNNKQQYPAYYNENKSVHNMPNSFSSNKASLHNMPNNFSSTQAKQKNNLSHYNNTNSSQNSSQVYSNHQYTAKINSFPSNTPTDNSMIFHNPLLDGDQGSVKNNIVSIQNPKNIKQPAFSNSALNQLSKDLIKAGEPFENQESFEKFKNLSLGIKGKTTIVPLTSNAKEFRPNENKSVKSLISEFLDSKVVWTNLDLGLKNLIKELNKKVIDNEIVKDIAKLVYNASLNRSFSYFGAKICDYMSKPDVGLVNFRKELLILAQKDFENLDNWLQSTENSSEKNKAIAFSFFLVELYLNLKVENCGVLQNISILGKKFVSAAEKLIENKSDSTIECAVMILKLGMSTILKQLGTSEDDKKYVGALDNLIKKIGFLNKTFPVMSNRCASIVNSFMKSRASLINQKHSQEVLSSENSHGEKLPVEENVSNTKVVEKEDIANETVYYNKDGSCYTETDLFLIEQEKYLDNENDQNSDAQDSMPADYGDYYEDFLNSLEKTE